MDSEYSSKLSKYRIGICALFVVVAMVGGAVIASPAAAESDSTEYTLSGTVTDESEETIDNAYIWIEQDGDFVTDVPTDADGEYEIELDEGNYVVYADADGFVSTDEAVTLDQDKTLNFELEDAATLEGAVTDTEDNTLEDVEVRVSQNGEEVTRTWTSSDGEYSVDLAEGEYTIEISERFYEDTSTDIDLTDTESKTHDFELTPLSTGTLEGEVIDEEGNQIEDARISIRQDGDFVESVWTNEDGTYTIELEDGDYDLSISEDGYLRDEQSISIEEDDTTTQDFELELAATVEGTVKDEDGTALEDVGVDVEKDRTSYGTQTGSDGEYSRDVPEGVYTVSISDPAYEGDSEEVSLTAGETTEENLEATPLSTGTLEGTITDDDDVSIENARISLRQDGDILESVSTDEHGDYSFEAAAGEYTVSTNVDGFIDEWREVSVTKNDQTVENIQLESAATIEGTVKDVDGEAVEDIRVYAYQNGDRIESTLTDELGNYTLEVTDGEYTVEIFDDQYEDVSEVVELTETESKTQDFDLVPLSTGTVEGTVTDTDDNSLGEVDVTIVQDGETVTETETDPNGDYEVEIETGEYTVEISDSLHEDTSTEVTISESETETEDFELDPLSTGTLEGEVTDGDGESLEEAFVDIQQDGESVDLVRTDADGQYDIELADGEYTVFAAKDGFQFEHRTVDIDEDATTIEDFELEELVTLDGEVTDTDDNALAEVDLRLVQDGETVEETETSPDGEYEVEVSAGEYTVEISDSIHEDISEEVKLTEAETKDFELEPLDTGTLEGEVTDEESDPIPDAELFIVQDGDLIERALSDENGNYEVELTDGEYDVVAAADGFIDESEEVDVSTDDTIEQNFALQKAVTLDGEVTDTQGNALGEVDISIVQDGETVEETETSPDGEYEVEVPGGEYTVEISDRLHEDTSEEVKLTEAETKDFELEPLSTGTLEGEVTDEEGEPIEDARISIRQDGDSIEFVRADEEGVYEVELTEGDYDLSVRADGFITQRQSIGISEDDTTTKGIELETAAEVEGTVTDEGGNEVEDIFVGVKQDGVLVEITLTGEDGSYSREVAEGDYTVSIIDPIYEKDNEEVSLTAGETTIQDLEATPASTGTLEGEVADEDENLIGEAYVNLFQDGVFIESVQTTENGEYELELGEGEYSALVGAGDSAATTTSISVEADETTTKDFVVEETGTIEGTVLDEDDTEISDSTVDLKQDGELLYAFTTRDDGSYESILPPGEYTLTGNANGYEEESYEVTVTEDTSKTQNIELVSEEDEETDTGGGGTPSLGPADFEVSIRDAPDSVDAGETVSIQVTVNNVGGSAGEQTITLERDGEHIADEEVLINRDQQRFVTLTGDVEASADGEQTFTISSEDDSAETVLVVEGDTEEETDDSETDEEESDETATEEDEDDSDAASDESTDADDADDEADDVVGEDDDQPGFGVAIAVIALLGLLAGTRLSARLE